MSASSLTTGGSNGGSGKNVFTHAGELIATFLKEYDKNSTDKKDLDSSLKNIELSLKGDTSIDPIDRLNNFISSDKNDTYQIAESMVQIALQSNLINTKIDNSKVQTKELVQEAYELLLTLETEYDAKFDKLEDFSVSQMARLFKIIGQTKKFAHDGIEINKRGLAELYKKKLDYFEGDDDTEVYFKTKQNAVGFTVGDGSGTFPEILLRGYVSPGSGNDGGVLGEVIELGGTPILGKLPHTIPTDHQMYDPDFVGKQYQCLHITRPVKIDGNIVLAENKQFYGTAVTARYADLAEYYTSDKFYSPGTLVVTGKEEFEVQSYNLESYPSIVGIVSDKPGFILNEQIKDEAESKQLSVVPIVLNGRSPVKIVGPVKKGDYIIPSDKVSGCCEAISPIRAYTEKYKGQVPFINLTLGTSLEDSQPSTILDDDLITNVKDTKNQLIHLIECKLK